MYTLQCPGGFPVPAKKGKFEITGFCVTLNDIALNSEFAIVDDAEIQEDWTAGRILSTLTDQKGILCHLKGLANVDTVLSYEFADTVKTRHGLSIYAVNTLPGSVCVYVR